MLSFSQYVRQEASKPSLPQRTIRTTRTSRKLNIPKPADVGTENPILEGVDSNMIYTSSSSSERGCKILPTLSKEQESSNVIHEKLELISMPHPQRRMQRKEYTFLWQVMIYTSQVLTPNPSWSTAQNTQQRSISIKYKINMFLFIDFQWLPRQGPQCPSKNLPFLEENEQFYRILNILYKNKIKIGVLA